MPHLESGQILHQDPPSSQVTALPECSGQFLVLARRSGGRVDGGLQGRTAPISVPQFSPPNNGDDESTDLPDSRMDALLHGRALGTGKVARMLAVFMTHDF